MNLLFLNSFLINKFILFVLKVPQGFRMSFSNTSEIQGQQHPECEKASHPSRKSVLQCYRHWWSRLLRGFFNRVNSVGWTIHGQPSSLAVQDGIKGGFIVKRLILKDAATESFREKDISSKKAICNPRRSCWFACVIN